MKALIQLLTLLCLLFSIDAHASRRGGGKRPEAEAKIKNNARQEAFSNALVGKIFPAKNRLLAEEISRSFESSKELRENGPKIAEKINELDVSKFSREKLSALQSGLSLALIVRKAQELHNEGKIDLNKESVAKELVDTVESSATKLVMEILNDKTESLSYEQLQQHFRNLRLTEGILTNEASAIAQQQLILASINKSLTARGQQKITTLEEIIRCLAGK